MQAIDRHYVTEEEFLAWPETKDKVELLDGEVVVSGSPHWWHQELVWRIQVLLRAWAAARTPAAFVSTDVDTVFGPDRILRPGALVLDALPSRKMPIRVIPRLCVDVTSSHVDYDRTTKRLVYAAAGVPEFWAIDPQGLVEVFHGPNLRERLAVAEGTLTSPTLPGLTVDAGALFRAP